MVLLLLGEAAAVDCQVPPLRVAMQQVAPGTIAGRVIAADTRAPIAGVQVTAIGVDAQALTADDGRFRMATIPAATYTVHFTHLGYRTHAQRT